VSEVNRESPAARRLLAQNVTAYTYQLVSSLQNARAPAVIRRLMGDRQRLLAELARDVNAKEEVDSLAALRAAVAESDRTLEALIG
jgi:hypothetical protein